MVGFGGKCLGLCLIMVACALKKASADPEWWRSTILYQIYPRSFLDSDGDGNGDLKGIIEKISYLDSLGVGAVWLSPIYQSPWEDMGYDISDYKSVHPLFGTLTIAQEMIQKLHEFGIRVLMDLVPNHTSDQHPWFNASRHKDPLYKDYYVWESPKGLDAEGKPVPPNNWLSAFGGSAWEWDETRQQFYLHQFGKYQVDLNYNNPLVVNEIKDVMRFWLSLGVDGFRVDTPHFLAEDPRLLDEPILPNCSSSNPYNCLDHIFTKNQPRTFEVLRQFHALLHDEYNSDKYMILEAYAPWPLQTNYYGPLMAPFNFQLINDFLKDTDAIKLNEIIGNYLENLPSYSTPNWVLGNHDNTRIGSRLGGEMVDAANMLILLLPGTSISYQGEEIGMTDGPVRDDQVLDCCSRDPQRTPFQWDYQWNFNAGFSSANRSWLPANPDYWQVNVKLEESDSESHLNTYRKLVHLKKFLAGNLQVKTAVFGKWVFGFKRENKGRTFYILINLNNYVEQIILKEGFPEVSEIVTVYIPAVNVGYDEGMRLRTDQLFMINPRSGFVLKAD